MSEPPSPSHLLQLSATAGQRLAELGLTIVCAESCTGGLLSSALTDVAGSSLYVLGGVVSYSNEAKMRLLGVPEDTLLTHGAVSAETAAAMAVGARALFHSDLALAVTGIAGPGGGTAAKPVGLVFLHLAGPDASWGERHVWPHDRIGNKLASAEAALLLLLRYLEDTGGQAGAGQPAISDRRPVVLDRPVVVEGAWRKSGWRLDAVWLDGQRQRISGTGRESQEADGATVVMAEAADGARLELVVDVSQGGWRLRRAWWPAPPLV